MNKRRIALVALVLVVSLVKGNVVFALISNPAGMARAFPAFGQLSNTGLRLMALLPLGEIVAYWLIVARVRRGTPLLITLTLAVTALDVYLGAWSHALIDVAITGAVLAVARWSEKA